MKLNRNLTCWALAGLLLVILAIELFTPRLLHRPAKATSVSAHQKAAPAAPSPASLATATSRPPFLADDPARDSLPPSILPVVILRGSDYEMGFQYGEQAAAYIDRTREDKWANALQRFTREQVLEALKANQTFIRRYTPEWIDFMQGMADGATRAGFPMAYTDVLLMNVTLPDTKTAVVPEGAAAEQLPPAKKSCSVASAWGSATKDGRLIGIDTLDTPDVAHAVVIVAFPNKGNAYMCGADAGEIGDHFLMNDKGFFLGNSGAAGRRGPRTRATASAGRRRSPGSSGSATPPSRRGTWS